MALSPDSLPERPINSSFAPIAPTVNGVTRYGSWSRVITKKAPAGMSSAVASVRTIWYKATVLSNVTASPANSKSKRQLVKKGTKVTVVTYGGTCKVQLPNKDMVYISLSKLNFTSFHLHEEVLQ